MNLLPTLALFVCACQPQSMDSFEGTGGAPRQVTVMLAGGFTPAYDVLAPQFERETGVALVSSYGASPWEVPGSIPTRLTGGEAADVIIVIRSSLDDLADMGAIRSASRVDLAHSYIGAAVRSGAAKPDISTRETLIDAVMAAESIGYSASVSGTYMSTVVFPQLEIWRQIEPKSKRIEGEWVAEAVARGEVELGFQQISEILPIEGADYVGPIPADLQRESTYSAGITDRAANPEDARRLVEFLSSEAVANTIAATGLTPVARGGNREGR